MKPALFVLALLLAACAAPAPLPSTAPSRSPDLSPTPTALATATPGVSPAPDACPAIIEVAALAAGACVPSGAVSVRGVLFTASEIDDPSFGTYLVDSTWGWRVLPRIALSGANIAEGPADGEPDPWRVFLRAAETVDAAGFAGRPVVALGEYQSTSANPVFVAREIRLDETPAVAPVCPADAQPYALADFLEADVRCFAPGASIEVRGVPYAAPELDDLPRVLAGAGIAYAPAWLAGARPNPVWLIDYESRAIAPRVPPGRGDEFVAPGTEVAATPFTTIRGHFGDPAAADCTAQATGEVAGARAPGPAEMVARCAAAFVFDAVVPTR